MRNPAPTPGPDLAQRRKDAGITTIRLAAEIGVSRATLSAWEHHHRLDSLRVHRYESALDAAYRAAVQP